MMTNILIKRSFALLILLIVVACSKQLLAQRVVKRIVENREIRIGITAQQPPFSMMSKSGDEIGFDIDIADRLAASIDVKPTFVIMDFAELLDALNKDEIDIVMSGLTITPERNLRFLFAGPYLISGQTVLTKSKKIIEAQLSDLRMNRIKVATLKGSTSETFVKRNLPGAELTLVDNYDNAVKMVIDNDIDFMLADYSQCAYARFRNLDKGLLIKEELLTVERIGIAIPADDPLLHNLIQNYITHLRESDELGKIEDKWFRNGSWLSEVE